MKIILKQKEKLLKIVNNMYDSDVKGYIDTVTEYDIENGKLQVIDNKNYSIRLEKSSIKFVKNDLENYNYFLGYYDDVAKKYIEKEIPTDTADLAPFFKIITNILIYARKKVKETNGVNEPGSADLLPF